jgi:hypothetical protein
VISSQARSLRRKTAPTTAAVMLIRLTSRNIHRCRYTIRRSKSFASSNARTFTPSSPRNSVQTAMPFDRDGCLHAARRTIDPTGLIFQAPQPEHRPAPLLPCLSSWLRLRLIPDRGLAGHNTHTIRAAINRLPVDVLLGRLITPDKARPILPRRSGSSSLSSSA